MSPQTDWELYSSGYKQYDCPGHSLNSSELAQTNAVRLGTSESSSILPGNVNLWILRSGGSRVSSRGTCVDNEIQECERLAIALTGGDESLGLSVAKSRGEREESLSYIKSFMTFKNFVYCMKGTDISSNIRI